MNRVRRPVRSQFERGLDHVMLRICKRAPLFFRIGFGAEGREGESAKGLASQSRAMSGVGGWYGGLEALSDLGAELGDERAEQAEHGTEHQSQCEDEAATGSDWRFTA